MADLTHQHTIASDLHSVGDACAVPRQSFHSDAGESKHRSSQKNKQETHMQLQPCGTKKSLNTDVERRIKMRFDGYWCRVSHGDNHGYFHDRRKTKLRVNQCVVVDAFAAQSMLIRIVASMTLTPPFHLKIGRFRRICFICAFPRSAE